MIIDNVNDIVNSSSQIGKEDDSSPMETDETLMKDWNILCEMNNYVEKVDNGVESLVYDFSSKIVLGEFGFYNSKPELMIRTWKRHEGKYLSQNAFDSLVKLIKKLVLECPPCQFPNSLYQLKSIEQKFLPVCFFKYEILYFTIF